MNFKKAKNIVKEEINKILSESRSNFWPGYYSDATADEIAFMKQRLAKKDDLKEELDNLYDSYSKPADESIRKIYDQDKEESLFFQREIYANIISTLLRDGIALPTKHVKQAYDIYEDILQDPKKEEYLKEEELEIFEKTIPVILEEMRSYANSDEEVVYTAGFLQDHDELKKSVDFDIGEIYSLSISTSNAQDYLFDSFSDEEIKEKINQIYQELNDKEYTNFQPFEPFLNDLDSFSREKLIQLCLILLG